MKKNHITQSYLCTFLYLYLRMGSYSLSAGSRLNKQGLSFLTELEDQCLLTLVREFTGPKSVRNSWHFPQGPKTAAATEPVCKASKTNHFCFFLQK